MEAEVLEKLKLSYEQKLKLWLSSQAGQTSGYAYEKSFLAFMREVSQETLQASVGLLPTSKNKKKTTLTRIGVLEVGESHVMHPGKGMGISDYVQDLACYVGHQEVYDEAEVLLKRIVGIDLSDKQIERLCHK